MNCKKCNAPLGKGDTFCTNCGEKVEETKQNTTPTANTESTNGSVFGWGVLGFFIPVAGLILFIVWLKNKNKAAKAAGIGALIGFVVELLLCGGFLLFLNGGSTLNVEMKKQTEYVLESGLKEYAYEADWNDHYYDLLGKSAKIIVRNNSYEELFTIKKTAGEKYTIITNSGEKIEVDPLQVDGSFNFYYIETNQLLIFNVGEDQNEFYFYDFKNNKLTKVFSSKDSGNESLSISDINIKNITADKRDDIVLDVTVSITDKKWVILLGVENGGYQSLEDLETKLKEEKLDDFIASKTLVYSDGSDGYTLSKNSSSKTIKEIYKELNGDSANNSTERTKDCTGIIEKGSNDYEYLIDLEKKALGCKTITYKVNDDFTVKYELKDSENLSNYRMYVNDKAVDGGILRFATNFYVNGKTLIAYAFSTDLGAPILLINTKGEIYSIEGYEDGNPSSGKDILDIDKMTKKNFKINDNGDLVVSGTRHSNQTIYGLTIDGKAAEDDICDIGLSSFTNKYNISNDYAYEADYTFELKSNGLYDLKYTKSNTTKTLEQYYNTSCNR